MDKLMKELEIACWAFYHMHCGTAEHLYSKERCYIIADRLKAEYALLIMNLLLSVARLCGKAMVEIINGGCYGVQRKC